MPTFNSLEAAIIIALLIASFSGGWITHGWKDTAAARYQIIAQQQQVIDQQQRTADREQKVAAITNHTEAQYETSIRNNDNAYDDLLVGLFQTSPANSNLPPLSRTTASVTTTCTPARLSRRDKQFLIGEAKRAADQQTELNLCLQWVNQESK